MTTPSVPPAPDAAIRQRSLAKYRQRAAGYDRTCGPTWTIRERTIAALDLQPGQGVLDVACGTGLSLALLRGCVGDSGQVYGFDHSAEMLTQAQARVAAAGWRNVTLIQAAAQEITLPQPVDALFFHYTHDILRSPTALDRILACAEARSPGGHRRGEVLPALACAAEPVGVLQELRLQRRAWRAAFAVGPHRAAPGGLAIHADPVRHGLYRQRPAAGRTHHAVVGTGQRIPHRNRSVASPHSGGEGEAASDGLRAQPFRRHCAGTPRRAGVPGDVRAAGAGSRSTRRSASRTGGPRRASCPITGWRRSSSRCGWCC